MYISEVHIENFRCFRDCRVELDPRLTILLGENNIGKTNFLEALGLIFSPNASYFNRQLSADDFWSGWCELEKLPVVRVQATIGGLQTPKEKALVAKWLINSQGDLKARVTYEYRPSVEADGPLPESLPIEDYEWTIYGGEVERERIDYRSLGQIQLEFLYALRDAEREMSRGAHRRVGRLISRFKPEGFDEEDLPDKRRLRQALSSLNSELENAEPVAQSQKSLNLRLEEVSGTSSRQRAVFRTSTLEFDDLVKNLQVLVGSEEGLEHGVEFNGLGYNNLLYVAALLTDFYRRRRLRGSSALTLPVVAIEEPEAHLHPHLQKLLNRYFASGTDGQVIVTTHSTHVSSSVDPSHIVVLHRDGQDDIQAAAVARQFQDTASSRRQLDALRRYLDATRSTLFFGKAVMLVEGLSEAILLPVIAKSCLGFDIDDKGISVVAVQGVSFRPFANLFGSQGIRRKCAILTDSDPGDDRFPLTRQDSEYEPCSRVINLQRDMEQRGGYVRVFPNLKTLEHDIVAYGNRRIVEQALDLAVELNEKVTKPKVKEATEEDDLRAFCGRFLDVISGAKGAFAQALAEKIAEESHSFHVPDYVLSAFDFLLDQSDQEGDNEP